VAAEPRREAHQRLQEWWDADAATYDQTASHSASDPVEAAAWRQALLRQLPPPPARILDVGAGTGTMSLLAAQMGHRVTALDLSPGMLSRAREKADAEGLDLETVVGPADVPPEGPFDAVMERHLLWTLPDPVAALKAWGAVAPRVVLYEGIWRAQDVVGKLKEKAAQTIRRLLGTAHDHHAEYDREMLAALPFPSGITPALILEALAQAGYRRARIERLRDVEWARLLSEPPLLGALESVPRFAVMAEAAT
jgi:ubiquinone/menaquinone biosynthesis C-methylase UbiE